MRRVAIVLAGSRGPDDPVALAAGVSHKALAVVSGQPMLARVLETLAARADLDRIGVVIERPDLVAGVAADAPRLAHLVAAGRLIAVPAASSPSRSLAAAFDAMNDADEWLVTTADHPLLTPAMIGYFLDHVPRDAEAAVALARRETIEAAWPETRRTYLKFRDAQLSGCNLFLFRGPNARRVPAFWVRMEAHRKRPWRMAWEIGPLAVLGFALRLITLAGAFRRLSAAIGVRAAPVELPFAEAAIDVDKAADLIEVEEILARRRT